MAEAKFGKDEARDRLEEGVMDVNCRKGSERISARWVP